MAARRLVIVMVVLLVASTTLAILLPRSDLKRNDDTSTGTTATTGVTSTTGITGTQAGSAPLQAENEPISVDGGRVVRETVSGAGDGPIDTRRPQKIFVVADDRLILSVDLGEPARIAIPGMGLTGDTTKFSPAVFDMLMTGTVPQKVINVDSGKTLATIYVGIEDKHRTDDGQTADKQQASGKS